LLTGVNGRKPMVETATAQINRVFSRLDKRALQFETAFAVREMLPAHARFCYCSQIDHLLPP
jgi:hypothetical protein